MMASKEHTDNAAQAIIEEIHRSLEAAAAGRVSADPIMAEFRATVAAIVAKPDHPAHREDLHSIAAWAQDMKRCCAERGIPTPWERFA